MIKSWWSTPRARLAVIVRLGLAAAIVYQPLGCSLLDPRSLLRAAFDVALLPFNSALADLLTSLAASASV